MTTSTFDRNPLFFHAIAANAVFSILCGLIMTFSPRAVAAWLGIERTAEIFATGVFLLCFAGFLLVTRWRRRIDSRLAWGIVAGDLGWVLYSAVLVGQFGSSFSMSGLWLIIDVALVVGLFAAAQARGLLRPRILGIT